MNEAKRKRLEAAGYWVCSAEDFLNNTEPLMDEARELLRALVESCTPAPAASGTIYGVRAPDRHVVEAARAFLSRPAAIVPPREPTEVASPARLRLAAHVIARGGAIPAHGALLDAAANRIESLIAAIAEGKQP